MEPELFNAAYYNVAYNNGRMKEAAQPSKASMGMAMARKRIFGQLQEVVGPPGTVEQPGVGFFNLPNSGPGKSPKKQRLDGTRVVGLAAQKVAAWESEACCGGSGACGVRENDPAMPLVPVAPAGPARPGPARPGPAQPRPSPARPSPARPTVPHPTPCNSSA
jgi:hypothetical protein